MLNQPTSSPMMKTMLGFFAACWAAAWPAQETISAALTIPIATCQCLVAMPISPSRGLKLRIRVAGLLLRQPADLRILQPDEEPLLGAVLAEVNQGRGFVLGQVVQAGLDDVRAVVADGEGNPLRLLIDGAVDELGLVG